MDQSKCSVDGCERPRRAKAMCLRHYGRVKRTGSVGPAGTIYRYGAVCSIEGCGGSHLARGWCRDHYDRWRRLGDPLLVRPPGWNLKPHPRQPKAETWRAVHTRLGKTRGRAADFPCTHCGKQAREWAYDNADPDVRFDAAKGMAFSLNLGHYTAMCSPCHRKFDTEHQRRLLAFLVGRVVELEAMVDAMRGTV